MRPQFQTIEEAISYFDEVDPIIEADDDDDWVYIWDQD